MLYHNLQYSMATRTVRLDDEAEAALKKIRKGTGLPISEALKQGLHALQDRVSKESPRTPYEIYLEVVSSATATPDGAAVAPARQVRGGPRAERRCARSTAGDPRRCGSFGRHLPKHDDRSSRPLMPGLLWTPSPSRIARANLTRFGQGKSYAELYDWSVTKPLEFWDAM